MTIEYIAPKLTKYGKIADIIEAGSVSVPVQSGLVTGDGILDVAFDTNGDGKADVIVGGASGGVTPVTFVGNAADASDSFDFYDSDGDGIADVVIGDLTSSYQYLQVIYSIGSRFLYLGNQPLSKPTVDNAGISVETSSDGGWNDPARD